MQHMSCGIIRSSSHVLQDLVHAAQVPICSYDSTGMDEVQSACGHVSRHFAVEKILSFAQLVGVLHETSVTLAMSADSLPLLQY